MKNYLTVSDNIIEIFINGDQTAQTIKDVVADYIINSNQVSKSGKPILILVDGTQTSKLPKEAVEVGLGAMQTMMYDKLAFASGNSDFLQTVTNMIQRTSPKIQERTKTFQSPQEAKAWLSEGYSLQD